MTASTVDLSRLRAQITRFAATSTKTLPQILNQRALNAIGRAFNLTPKTPRSKIESELGSIIKANRLTKSGKLVSKAVAVSQVDFYGQGPRIAIIINAWRKRAGRPGLEGAEMAKAVQKFLQARLRSVAYEAAGWVPSMRVMAQHLTKPFILARLKGVSVYRVQGAGSAARSESWHPEAWAVNAAKDIDKVGATALQRGIDEETEELRRHLDEDFRPVVEEFNRGSH